MKLLAFDGSGPQAGVAVSSGGRIVFSGETSGPNNRKEGLLKEVAAALKKARLDASKLDAVVVGLGPGSFTGLRIAVTAAKALAWSAGIRLYGFSTLEAIAFARGEKSVVTEAGRGNIYTWRVGQKPRLEKKSAAHSLTPPVSAAAIAEALVRLAEAHPKKKSDDPFKLEPLYVYPKDCNVTLA